MSDVYSVGHTVRSHTEGRITHTDPISGLSNEERGLAEHAAEFAVCALARAPAELLPVVMCVGRQQAVIEYRIGKVSGLSELPH